MELLTEGEREKKKVGGKVAKMAALDKDVGQMRGKVNTCG